MFTCSVCDASFEPTRRQLDLARRGRFGIRARLHCPQHRHTQSAARASGMTWRCARCAIEFEPSYRQYCAGVKWGCRQFCPEHRPRHRKVPLPREPQPCAECGRIFIPTTLQVGRNLGTSNRLFCSAACGQRANRRESDAARAHRRRATAVGIAALLQRMRLTMIVLYDRDSRCGEIPRNLKHYECMQ